MSSVDVRRKKGERFETLLRRFNKRIIGSGKIIQARKERFRDKPLNKNKLKSLALRKMKITEKRSWLEKTGQLPEEKYGRRRRR